MSGTRALSAEPARATAYYYGDLEKNKRQNEQQEDTREHEGGADDPGSRGGPGDTYSTAGTFPMPQTKEKEPLLAELELVGRVPLTQLGGEGVRRSRSWYLCCPNVGEEEASRESSWRYSSLRPVTAPPLPGQNGVTGTVASLGGGRGDAASLRAERDALARALSAERARAAAAARAHDARLAELHGVIAELVRRRAANGRAAVILEEDPSEDECESNTQPAGGGGDDRDGRETTDVQNDSSSETSPAELTQEEREEEDDSTERAASPPPRGSSVVLSEGESEVCLDTSRCCRHVRADADSCGRERGSPGPPPASPGPPPASPGLPPPSPSKCESKMASRVRLKRTEQTRDSSEEEEDEAWRAAAERLALDVCAQADLREALASQEDEEVQELGAALAHVRLWRARCGRLAADCRVLDCALARAVDTAHSLSCACAVQESCMVSVCGALRAADRALEVYDVLLALAETQHAPAREQRQSAEAVARRVLWRLEAAPPAWGEPLLPPGPWAERPRSEPTPPPWSDECEARLRARAAQLKRETVQMRALTTPPALYSPHECGGPQSVCMSEMEAAVLVQEVLADRERDAAAGLKRHVR